MLTIDTFMAEKIRPWLEQAGAILVWYSVNLSNPGAWWLTPLGASKPTWQAGNEPEVVYPADLGVDDYQEVKRIRVYTRLSSSGLSIKLTYDSDQRLNTAMRQVAEKTGETPVYHFEGDYAVISIPTTPIPYTEWSQSHV